MTSCDAKTVCRASNRDHVPNADFNQEQHTTKVQKFKRYGLNSDLLCFW